MDLPYFFPTDINKNLAGLGQNPFRKKFSVVFQDFGRCGHVDVKPSDGDGNTSQTVYTPQRLNNKQSDRSVLCACIPTIPLSQIPAEVHFPLEDNVIGNLPHLPAKVRSFSRSLAQVSASFRQGVSWGRPFLSAKRTLDKVRSSDRISDLRLDTIEGNLPGSISNLLGAYTDLSQQSSFHAYNPRYSGGLLSCVQDTDGDRVRHLLFHARGLGLDRLALMIAEPSDAHLVPSCLVAERQMKGVFQVDAVAVQDSVYVAARHETSCSVFSVPRTQCMDQLLLDDVTPSASRVTQSRHRCGSQPSSRTVSFRSLGGCDFKEGKVLTSVCMSPYLPGEGLFCGESGTVKLWSATQGVVRTISKQPRFECRDSWCHAYCGSHPRQVVLADRTAVQMLDHRDGFRSSVDLFALPSPLVHKKDGVMAAHRNGDSSPLHVVATSRCVLVVDQRFGGSPVMQWYPDLQGPVQYLASTEYHSDSRERRGVVLAGCQHPAEVMCYPFNHGSGLPVSTPLSPWRLSRMCDISDDQQCSGLHMTTHPLFLEQRLRLSLTGLAVAKGSRPGSFLTYQADCYGELFFQQYSTPNNVRTAVKTGVAHPGNSAHHVPLDVQNHVGSWLERLEKQVIAMERALQKKKLKKGRGVSIRQQFQTGIECRPAEETGERCFLCGDDVDHSNGSHHGNNKRYCRRCWDCHQRFSGKVQPKRQSSSRSLQSPPSHRHNNSSGYDVTLVSEGMSLLDTVLPGVESCGTDGSASVHLELTKKTHPDLADLVRVREEDRARLLEDLKSKNRKLRERKSRKRKVEEDNAAAAAAAAAGADAVDTGTPAHSVFNTVEHQQQNSRIDEVLSTLVRPRQPETVSSDVTYSAPCGDMDRENTPPDAEQEDTTFDLFDDLEPEESVQEPQHVSQDDDDEFFSSQDLFTPITAPPRVDLPQNSETLSASPGQSQRHSEEDRNAHVSEDLFLTSTQKDSQSLSPNYRQSSSQKLDFFSPSVSPISASKRVKGSESVHSQSQSQPCSPRLEQSTFSPFSGPASVPQSLKFRTPDKNVALSPLRNSNKSLEKQKSKSAKKCRFSLGGFC